MTATQLEGKMSGPRLELLWESKTDLTVMMSEPRKESTVLLMAPRTVE